ncbi:MAG: hypothetical protein ABW321_25775 [Polyangiales bacterium]
MHPLFTRVAWVLLLSLSVHCGDGDERRTAAVPPPRGMPNPRDAGLTEMNVERCVVDQALLDEHKACASDEDCVVLAYRPTCCDYTRVVGVARSETDVVQRCADEAPPLCTCDSLPHRAEDGRASDPAAKNVRASCVEGRCQSRVTKRNCGPIKVCTENELCVSYGNVPGQAPDEAGQSNNAYLSYACVANPCASSLTCSCAQPVCAARDDVDRKCEIELNVDCDVACVPYRD